MPEEQGTNHQLGLGWVDNTRASLPHRGAIVNCLSPRALTGWGPQPPSSSGADRQLCLAGDALFPPLSKYHVVRLFLGLFPHHTPVLGFQFILKEHKPRQGVMLLF